MKPIDVYVDLDGIAWPLATLAPEERRLVARLRRRARANPDWDAFDNYWTRAVPAFYEARGLARPATMQTIPYQIAQDLSSRLGIAAGLIREPDFRDELEDLILNHFPSRQAFCQASGLSEALVNDILEGRKDLSLATLEQALERLGYRLRFAPKSRRKRTG